MHHQISSALAISTGYSRRRRDIDLTPFGLASSSSMANIQQEGVLNQFHMFWLPIIHEYQTASAICGYLSCAFAKMIACLPFSAEAKREDIRDLLCDEKQVFQQTAQVMQFISERRAEYISSHRSAFTQKEELHYLKNWVANYEISDYFQSLDPDISQHIVFVRFNQYPEYESATHEERDRLQEEAQFGGRKGDKSSKQSFDASDPKASAFIIEFFAERLQNTALRNRVLLRPREVDGRNWRVAVLDLNGHFAVAVPCGGSLVLFNTTDFNYLSGSSGLTVAVAHDLMPLSSSPLS
jgi:hypothetical protein